MAKAKRNTLRELPRPLVVLSQNRAVIGAVPKKPDSGDFAAGVIPNRRACTEQSLTSRGLRCWPAEPHHRRFGASDILGPNQSQTTEATALPGGKVQGTVVRHLLAVHGVHCHFVRSGGPEIRHFAGRWNRYEAAMSRP